MSTYENCFELVGSVRQAVGEYSAAKVRGEDTLGGYDNTYIVKKINLAIRELYALIARRAPDLFIEETSLTAVNSIFTLPWDFGRLISFKNENGIRVTKIGERERRLVNADGSDMAYRRVGQTLVLDKAGVGKTYTLVYMRKPRNIHHGLVKAGASQSITFCAKAPKIADYFNGMVVENETSDWVDTISDYTADRVATIGAETPVKNDAYGLVPEIPDWSHHLIGPRATLMVRQEHPLTKRKPTAQDYKEYRELARSTLLDFTPAQDPEEIADIFTDFTPKEGGIII